MGVRFYNKGDHPAGFVGFRVSRSVDGEPRQAYFSVDDTDPESVNYKRKKLEAYRVAVAWEEEALAGEYQRFITQDGPQTPPERGVGVHRLTLRFDKDRRGNWVPAFLVTGVAEGDPQHRINRVFTMQGRGLRGAWEKAVHYWADLHAIRDVDRQRVLANPPAPDRFKQLRYFERDTNGRDIPVESLRAAFQDQRLAIQNERVATNAQQVIGEKPSTTAADIYAWFERESQL